VGGYGESGQQQQSECEHAQFCGHQCLSFFLNPEATLFVIPDAVQRRSETP